MGISIRIPGVSFSKFVDQEVPYIELATGFWLFGKDKATSQINLAPNSPIATPSWLGTGQPSFGNGYMDVSPAGGASATLDTGIMQVGTAPFTYISVAAPQHVNDQMLCGNWHSGINSALLGCVAATDALMLASGGGAFSSTLVPPGGAVSFMAGTRSATERVVYLHNGEALQSQTGTDYAGGANNTYRIGPMGGIGNQFITATDRHAANMFFPVALTSAQILEIYSYLKWKLSTRGVSVL